MEVAKGVRAPADLILLSTTETSGACFIKADQLDGEGETDWKLRLAVSHTQRVERTENMLNIKASVYSEKPQKDIHGFIGKLSNYSGEDSLGVVRGCGGQWHPGRVG